MIIRPAIGGSVSRALDYQGSSPCTWNKHNCWHKWVLRNGGRFFESSLVQVGYRGNTFVIWLLLVKWEAFLEKRVLTYISEKVGRGDLILGLQI